MASNTIVKFALAIFAASTLINPAAGHGAIVSAVGDAGGTGMALGVDTSTPRDGTRRRPFQQDSTRFRGDSAETFGETLAGGDNQLEEGTQAILAETGDQLPQVTAGGELQMTLHQVNSDGAGPYECMINADGTGTSWQDITVTQNVPGRRSRNRDGEATDFPLTASIPASQSCTGTVAGQDNVCLVRCQNSARAGPFGGVVPVQMAGTATPADARRALARSVKMRLMKTKKAKRGVSLEEDLRDPDLREELLEEGDI
ncbi:hypothetical protein MMYC01_200228 [Madurella mycetomatis]|uniref:Uncharacterized protein n=1 Tax=Madurella mycetomatis TaxID=100816 RepID=A0A175W6G9_9PEZI|nr:hypothetical protein MMYC01_204559 [Madurella mycetomatis]KXX83194.1 hypothetical protein MMYC01_200228 [Madurella mycetomatis]